MEWNGASTIMGRNINFTVFWLVVSTHLKNISQNGNLPQIGVKIKNIWNHHLDKFHWFFLRAPYLRHLFLGPAGWLWSLDFRKSSLLDGSKIPVKLADTLNIYHYLGRVFTTSQVVGLGISTINQQLQQFKTPAKEWVVRLKKWETSSFCRRVFAVPFLASLSSWHVSLWKNRDFVKKAFKKICFDLRPTEMLPNSFQKRKKTWVPLWKQRENSPRAVQFVGSEKTPRW